MDNKMGNKTSITTNNIKGDDVDMELIKIMSDEDKEIQLDKKILEMAIKSGATTDEIFERSNMTLKEISDSIEETNKKLKQSLKDREERYKTFEDTLSKSEESLKLMQQERELEATKRNLEATKHSREQIDRLTKIDKDAEALRVTMAFLVGSVSTSIVYGIINLLF